MPALQNDSLTSSKRAKAGPNLPPSRAHRPLPFGPASASLAAFDVVSFAEQARKLLQKAQAKLEAPAVRWPAGMTGEGMADESEATKTVAERCSVKDIVDSTSPFFAENAPRLTLQRAVHKRWLPFGLSSSASPAKRKKREVTADPEEGQTGENGEKDAESGVIGCDEAEEAQERVERLLKVTGESESRLGILQPQPNIDQFVRKCKTCDFNSLAEILSAQQPDPPAHAEAQAALSDPLSNLLYTFVLQPVVRRSALISGDNVQRVRMYHTPQRQVLVCLGSTTLFEILKELRLAREGVPKEEAPPPTPPPGSEDEEEEEEQPGQRMDQSGTFGGGGKGKEKKVRRTRWKSEKRVTGSCFAVEGVLYADEEDEESGKRDYADMILDLVDATKWPKLAPASSPPPQVDPSHALSPTLDSASPAPDKPATAKPNLVKGPSIRNTKLGELEGLKTGNPYWFLTHGNVEAIWTIEEIRYRHPLDPAPTSLPSSSHPYPLTTYLSRPTASSTSSLTSSASTSALSSRCRVCERDPGFVVVLNDELVGETPALVCQVCLDTLHPKKGEQEEDEEEEDEEEDEEEEGEDEWDEMEKGRKFMKQGPEGRTRVRIVPIVA
ncbi:hypothetical protein JCM8547_000907 [Rhodosporidiobolus lusitaniae]